MTVVEPGAIVAVSPAKPPASARAGDGANTHGGSKQLSLFDLEGAGAIAAPVAIKPPAAVQPVLHKPALTRAGAHA